MLSADHDQLTLRAERFVSEIRNPVLKHKLVDGFSAIGGGAAPAVELPAKLVAVTHKNKTATRLEQELRHSKTPVIARIVENRVMLDLRTVPESDEETLLDILNQLA
jgi:L-seryl-tRNA(Ser) seleniumtransferase